MEETFGALLRTLQQAQSQVLDVVADYRVTGSQFSVLAAVVNQPGIDQRGVTAATFIDRSTVASVVPKLVDRGLVISSRSSDDARRDQLIPTSEAIGLMYDASPRLEAGNDGLLTALPAPERERFLRLLRRVAYADRQDPPELYVIPSPDGVRPPLEVAWGLGRSLRGSLQRHNRLWAEQFGTLVTQIQYLALKVVEETAEIDQNTLGRIIALDKASLTEMLVRLHRRGLIAKLRDPHDGRRRLLELTSPARVLLSGVDEQVPGVDEEFLRPLPASQKAFFAKVIRQLAESCRVRAADSGRTPSSRMTQRCSTR